MSNAATGIWSALGAVIGGAAGAFAGKQAAVYRPRGYGARRGSGETEDAMVIGGATGAVIGAFFAATVTGEPALPPQASNQLPNR